MAGKLKEQTAEAEKESGFGVLDVAHQIWLAGMGAFARTTQEGTKMFTNLVEEGQKLQSQSRSAATGAVSSVVDRAGENWDRVEGIFEDRVQRVLERLGVPTSDDIEALSKRVDQLSEAVKQLSEQQAAAKSASAASKTRTSSAKSSSSASSAKS
ncbi:phasin family protein [Ectothiorhodospiraceae bacterium WFHF3C12]|nr:phasin family protein [Ectothiorhodospiraceae bacterium WFHF3C12]